MIVIHFHAWHTNCAVGLSEGDCCQQSIMSSTIAGKAGSKLRSFNEGRFPWLMAMLILKLWSPSNGIWPVKSSKRSIANENMSTYCARVRHLDHYLHCNVFVFFCHCEKLWQCFSIVILSLLLFTEISKIPISGYLKHLMRNNHLPNTFHIVRHPALIGKMLWFPCHANIWCCILTKEMKDCM